MPDGDRKGLRRPLKRLFSKKSRNKASNDTAEPQAGTILDGDFRSSAEASTSDRIPVGDPNSSVVRHLYAAVDQQSRHLFCLVEIFYRAAVTICRPSRPQRLREVAGQLAVSRMQVGGDPYQSDLRYAQEDQPNSALQPTDRPDSAGKLSFRCGGLSI